RLVAVVEKLGRAGALKNSMVELESMGFGAKAVAFSRIERFIHGVLDLKVSNKGLGKGMTPLFRGVGKLKPVLPLLGVLLATGVGLIAMFQGLLLDAIGGRPMDVGGSYGMGALYIYFGAVLALSVREIFRGWALGGHGCAVASAGIKAPLFILGLHLDTRHIFRAGRQGERAMALAGITGVTLTMGVLLLGVEQGGTHLLWNAQGCALSVLGAAGVLLAMLCPFLESDGGILLDRMFSTGDARLHANAYLKKRYVRGFKDRDLFKGEFNIIMLVVLSLGWLYGSLLFTSRMLAGVFLPSLREMDLAQKLMEAMMVNNLLEKLIICFMAMMLTAFVGGFLMLFGIYLVRAVMGGRAPAWGKPLEVESDGDLVAREIKANPLFEGMSSAVHGELAAMVHTLKFKEGDNIVIQGTEGDRFCMIVEGEADVISVADSGVETVLDTLGDGDSFGEMALIEEGGLRNATIRAIGPMTILSLSRDDFVNALEKSGQDLESVTQILRSSSAIRKSTIFGDMTPSALRQLREMLDREEVQADTVIVREGDVGDRFYLIESGEVSVERDDEDAVLNNLGPGEFFGEMALLWDVPRTASVRTTEPTVVLSLDRSHFKSIMTRNFTAGVRLERQADERRGRGRA
ncbi:MAG: cyclic nucleotide-binding domain-containing protein, partial [Myxococcota bacterium]|nr:cyclic nucleotide-binding domain-containing protein [Myxococcota bacterium]